MYSETEFEHIFKEYYTYLCNLAYKILYDFSKSEDLVQDVFMKIWHKRESLEIKGKVKSYLSKAVINACLNDIKKNKKQLSIEQVPIIIEKQVSNNDDLLQKELEEQINTIIDKLSPKCQLVFTLSRFEGKSNQEIAELMDISKKTVENQMGKALRKLRIGLSHYLGNHQI